MMGWRVGVVWRGTAASPPLARARSGECRRWRQPVPACESASAEASAVAAAPRRTTRLAWAVETTCRLRPPPRRRRTERERVAASRRDRAATRAEVGAASLRGAVRRRRSCSSFCLFLVRARAFGTRSRVPRLTRLPGPWEGERGEGTGRMGRENTRNGRGKKNSRRPHKPGARASQTMRARRAGAYCRINPNKDALEGRRATKRVEERAAIRGDHGAGAGCAGARPFSRELLLVHSAERQEKGGREFENVCVLLVV